MGTNIPYSIAANAKEFLAGMAAEQASYYKDKADAAKDINTFVSDVDRKLREVYDKYIPNVHVIDAEVFTNIIANRLAQAGKNVLDPGSDTGIAYKFTDATSSEYLGLKSVVLDSLTTYHNKLLSSQGPNINPVASLNELSKALFIRTRKIDNAVSARVLGVEFSRNINTIFGKRAVLAAVDPSLGSSPTKFVFFSSSFNAIGKPIKESVYKPVEEYIRNTLGTDTISKFALGNLVNAGHAALVSDLESFVNSPAFAQVLYGVSTGRSSVTSNVREAAEVFKIESKLLENKIEVNKAFFSGTSGYGILLSLGVTFTNIEDAEANQERGRTAEARAVRSFDIAKPAALSNSAKKSITDKLLRIVFRNNPVLGRSSRNILDFVTDSIVDRLSGKTTKAENSKKIVRSSKRVKTAVRSDSVGTKFPQVKAKTPTKVPLKAAVGEGGFSLTKLQLLINAHLQDVISANMGDGDRRDILNYRTGRLAGSARVERLTKSRDGMITAFYSYMQNPYATFSAGGRQSRPITRDPKLLISKSIREIAASAVANRMRAVLA